MKSLDKSSDLFLLAGCMMQDSEKDKLDKMLSDLKLKYFGTQDVILHYRDIRKRDKHFQILQDNQVNQRFSADLQSILTTVNYKIVLSIIDKRAHIQEYGKTAGDPYMIAFNFLIERLIYEGKNDMVSKIIIERRGKKEDEHLLETWIRIYRRGLYKIEAKEVQKKIQELKMQYKHDNILGLQLADIVASSFSRKFRHLDKDEDFFESIRERIMRNADGVMGYGIKIFPRNSTLNKTISPLF